MSLQEILFFYHVPLEKPCVPGIPEGPWWPEAGPPPTPIEPLSIGVAEGTAPVNGAIVGGLIAQISSVASILLI